MTEKELFSVVGIRKEQDAVPSGKKERKRLPYLSLFLLTVILLGCIFAELIMTRDPAYLDLANSTHGPNSEFLFGTDTLGRDIFSCIWYGGRISLFIGFLATLLSTLIAVVYGSLSGVAPAWLDALLMRLDEIFLSVPSLLVVIFVQAVLGKNGIWSVSVAIGITTWCGIAKVVRTEVRQIRDSGYVVAAKCMGGGFFHILRRHLAPNFISSILFMVVMNVRSAIVMESTLSFMGMGLPLETVSWGSMLSLAENAMLTGAWWIILIPGLFLVAVLMCLTNLGDWLQSRLRR